MNLFNVAMDDSCNGRQWRCGCRFNQDGPGGWVSEDDYTPENCLKGVGACSGLIIIAKVISDTGSTEYCYPDKATSKRLTRTALVNNSYIFRIESAKLDS